MKNSDSQNHSGRMKLILATIPSLDCETVSQALVSQDFGVTRIASSGGFFRRGSTTLLIGVDAARADEAIHLIRTTCAPATEPGASRVILFVLNVESHAQV